MEAAVVIYQLFRVGRVPCKLNNERNEKPRRERERACENGLWSATEKLARVGLSQLPTSVRVKSLKL